MSVRLEKSVMRNNVVSGYAKEKLKAKEQSKKQ